MFRDVSQLLHDHASVEQIFFFFHSCTRVLYASDEHKKALVKFPLWSIENGETLCVLKRAKGKSAFFKHSESQSKKRTGERTDFHWVCTEHSWSEEALNCKREFFSNEKSYFISFIAYLLEILVNFRGISDKSWLTIG
jgi:hypothetical protein